MATTEMNCLASGGGTEKWYIKPLSISASTAPTWSNTPIKPNKVYLTFTSGNNRDGSVITNVDPTTCTVGNTLYVTTDGTNWSTSAFTFTITDTSVALSGSISSAVQGGSFFIAE